VIPPGGDHVEVTWFAPTSHRKRDDEGDTVKYMLLIYGNDQTWDALQAEGIESVYDRHRAVLAETRAAGELLASDGLTIDNARIVQLHEGVPAVTDGPFTESKEVLAGYYLLECSLDRATELAARLPEARYSPIEIRALTAAFEE
jgi:hypothetical protein